MSTALLSITCLKAQKQLRILKGKWNLTSSMIHTSKIISAKGNEHPFKIKNKKILAKVQNSLNNINESNQHELLADVVTPYWRISYDEELQMKYSSSINIMKYLFPDSSSKIKNIIPSPLRDSYRSKDEFSVWPGLDDNPKTVGYFIGSPALGRVVCVPPSSLKNIKEAHKNIAQLYQAYIRQSPLPVSYQLYDGGFWRNIIVRSNDAGELMALIITLPGQSTPQLIQQQQTLLKDYFSHHVPNLSLFHQSCPHVRCSKEQAPIHHLSGKPHLTENLSNFKFRISPDSFFQVNKAAAEKLYQTVIEMAHLKHYTTLLDLYCGTGAISIVASPFTRGCVGIEEVGSAVEDAIFNAEINNISNCSFIAGKVELQLAKVLKKLDLSTSIVAVLNPGRGGAMEGVISLLRQNLLVQRVIYISCKPDNPLTMKNFRQLCERVGPDAKPFHFNRAVPVDIFPYTNHYELVLCFERET